MEDVSFCSDPPTRRFFSLSGPTSAVIFVSTYQQKKINIILELKVSALSLQDMYRLGTGGRLQGRQVEDIGNPRFGIDNGEELTFEPRERK